jgi:hypothetical protein
MRTCRPQAKYRGITATAPHLPTETFRGVIASKAKQSRLRDCAGRFVWIASLSLAMTAERRPIK